MSIERAVVIVILTLLAMFVFFFLFRELDDETSSAILDHVAGRGWCRTCRAA